MTMNNAGVGITISGKDEASGAVRKAEGSFQGLFATIKKGWQNSSLALGAIGYKSLALGKSVSGALEAAANKSADFERAMKFAQARTASTNEQMEKFRDVILGPEFKGKNVDIVAAAFQRLTEETGNADESMKLLKASMNLSRVTALDEAGAASLLADVTGSFGISADKAGETTDKMAWAMKRFGLTGDEIQPLLFATASGAQLVGASFEEVMLAAGMIKSVMPLAGRSAMAANMAMIQLADPNVQKELKKQGVAVKDNAGKFRPLTSVIGDLARKTQDMTEAQRAQTLASIFSSRSSGGLSVIMKQLDKGYTTTTGQVLKGADALAYLRQEMEASKGTAESMAKVITDDYAGALKRLENAQKRFAQTVGSTTAELRRPFVEKGAMAVNTLVAAFQKMSPGTQKIVVGFTAAFAGLTTVLGKVLVATTVMKMFNVGILDLVFSLVKFTLIVAPLTVLLGGLGVGLFVLYRAAKKNAGGIGDSFSEMWRKIKLGWSAMVDIFSNGGLSDSMKQELSRAENSGVLKFANTIERLRVRLGAFFEGFSSGLRRAMDELGPQANELLGRFKWIADLFTGDAFKDPLANWTVSGQEAGYAMKDFAIGSLKTLGSLADTLGKVVDYMKGISAKDVSDGIKSIVSVFRTLHAIGSAVYTVFSTVFQVFSRIGTVIGLMAESFGNFIDQLKSAKDTPIGRFISGLMTASFSKTKGDNAAERWRDYSEHFNFQGADAAGGLSGRRAAVQTMATNRRVGAWWEKSNIESDMAEIAPETERLKGLINQGAASEGEKQKYIEMMVELKKMTTRLENLSLTATIDDDVLMRLTTRKYEADSQRDLVPATAEE